MCVSHTFRTPHLSPNALDSDNDAENPDCECLLCDETLDLRLFENTGRGTGSEHVETADDEPSSLSMVYRESTQLDLKLVRVPCRWTHTVF